MSTVKEIAKMIDHSILSPLYTDEDLIRECAVAKKYEVASVCVKPYAVKLAVEQLKGSSVLVGCVIGFPAGNSAIAVKAFETEQACKDGAVEIDMVINIGKVLQEDWPYLEEEIRSVVDIAHRYNAITKVIFETGYVTEDEHKIRLCEICSKVGAEYVKTSTGFGFVKDADGRFSYTGATAHDLELMRKHSSPAVKVKASGGVRTLTELLKFMELGISRCGATATAAILEEARILFQE
ncbi:MAG: deoxyribose-phosphate aldolase [Bacteroidia bacterium]|nr:deoxyribose-phosphate aldolase [Bacteroidia bacterium]